MSWISVRGGICGGRFFGMPNAFFDFEKRIAGRLVIVNTGPATQTVNICTPANKPGTYEAQYRLPLAAMLLDDAHLPPLEDLASLDGWLAGRGATTVIRKTNHIKVRGRYIEAPKPGDLWVEKAIAAVDVAITDLTNEFVTHPYLFRVEHSLHTRLYALLIQRPLLADRFPIGKTNQITQLVHKEWPVRHPRVVNGVNGVRGLFDLAVLAPQQLKYATVEGFRAGRIAAPIVIEIGLDYGFEHLRLDHEKLEHNGVTAPYLVHLSRVAVKDEDQTQKFICDRPSPFRTAYVHHKKDGSHSVKQVSDHHVSASGG